MKRYGQYCPVARAAEVLAERWTLLVVRELLSGEDRFRAIGRGVPRMSPSMLSSRLRELQRCGIVRRYVEDGEPHYELTEAGAELEPIVRLMGEWGARWMQEFHTDDFDPVLLMLDIKRQAQPARMPDPDATVELHFLDAPEPLRRWWLVLSSVDGIDVCDADPGRPVDVWMETEVSALTRVWSGDIAWQKALREKLVRLTGNRTACRALPGWLHTSQYAEVPRADVSLRR